MINLMIIVQALPARRQPGTSGWLRSLLIAATVWTRPLAADPSEQAYKMILRNQKPSSEVASSKPKRAASGRFFQAQWTPEAPDQEVPMRSVHSWSLGIKTLASKDLKGARVEVKGLMPQHGHGFATEPQVVEVHPGLYRIQGMQFHMPGWWVVRVEITKGEETETLEFELWL